MKYYTLFLVTLLSFTTLFAQDVDTVVDLEEAVNYEQYDSSFTEAEEYNDESSDTLVSDTIVSPEQLDGLKQYQSANITIQRFDEKKWKEVIKDKNYDEELLEEEDEAENDNPVRVTSPWNSDLLRMVSFIVIIALALYVIYMIVRNTTFSAKLKKPQSQLSPEAAVEDIEDLDINVWLTKALAEGNFKLAVRLYYLALLKKLNETGFIVWKKEKTNREYLSELLSRDYFNEVRILTLAYEQVWYGEHTLSQATFQRLAADFESLNQKLNTSRDK